MKNILVLFFAVVISGCVTTTPYSKGNTVSDSVHSNTQSRCEENYPSGGWQSRYPVGSFFAQADDRTYDGKGFKLKLNKMLNGYVCTIRVVRGVQLPNWNGETPAPINFAQYFPECTFSQTYDPGDNHGHYLDVAAADAFCPNL